MLELALSGLPPVLLTPFCPLLVPSPQFDLFLKNDFAVLYLLFWCYEFAVSGLIFLLSTIISDAAASNQLGLVYVIIGFIFQAQGGGACLQKYNKIWKPGHPPLSRAYAACTPVVHPFLIEED